MSKIKKKKNNNQKYIAIMIIAFIIMIAAVILIAVLITKNKTKDVVTNVANNVPQTDEEIEEFEKEEIKNMSESKRMKRYIGMFLEDIEEGNYYDAYSVLNEEFKNNYFPRLEDFEEYAKKYLNSSTLAITYDNIERLGNNKTGNMYVIWTTITDIFMPKLAENEEIEQTNFVIVENNYNDYEMSFSVKTDEE